MIGISKLYCGTVEPSDALRYGRRSKDLPSHLLQFSQDKKPVVVWNVTRSCNLKCIHCYAHAVRRNPEPELETEQAIRVLDDLAAFGAPVVLFSGGEPLLRHDLDRLARYAVEKGMRAVISTNGTLITRKRARELKEVGLSYVGVSLDGLEKVHDHFRGETGAFKAAMAGIRNCQDEGLKVGLRFTMNRFNKDEVGGLFDILEKDSIPRICFYHLVYAGRGSELIRDDLDHQETRRVVDLIMDRTKDLNDRSMPKEVLTVDNHADGPYLYLRMVKENNPRAEEVMQLLRMNEGNNSGRGIGCISWDGSVHADQFWRHLSFGNVLEKPFSRIWTDLSHPVMAMLKDKKRYVGGRCATCRWLDICGGNFRVRAEAVTGDLWAPDPACYLTDEEIGK
ncbi:MAG: 12,18-didecarboxysiroheme deacetylase [Desulfobacteraceae bacterium]|nr:MAG: 12,18-didecarboxysiroheme deacetylase [Desulfobacteraceae bacterium]